jgi:HPt (histidine-containing phosphotransfer) domain-containing protein
VLMALNLSFADQGTHLAQGIEPFARGRSGLPCMMPGGDNKAAGLAQRIIIPEVSSMSKVENGALDADTIAALREDGSLLSELRDLFSAEVTCQLAAMVQARSDRDPKVLAHAAHRLKGSAVTFGAREMQRICIEIEHSADSLESSGVDQMIEELRAECERVKRALDDAV